MRRVEDPRFLSGHGRGVGHADPRRQRRRRDQGRAAGRRLESRRARLLDVEPGQAERRAGPRAHRGPRGRPPAGAPGRRRRRELPAGRRRAARHRVLRPGSRQSATDLLLDLRLRTQQPRPRSPGLRGRRRGAGRSDERPRPHQRRRAGPGPGRPDLHRHAGPQLRRRPARRPGDHGRAPGPRRDRPGPEDRDQPAPGRHRRHDAAQREAGPRRERPGAGADAPDDPRRRRALFPHRRVRRRQVDPDVCPPGPPFPQLAHRVGPGRGAR